MRMTTKGRYGVRAVVNLAREAADHPVPISRIAEEEHLSAEFLEQIFFKLKKAGLIRSIRGPKGGFLLNGKAAEISLKTILDAVGETLYPVPCTNGRAEKRCSRQSSCSMSPVWQNFSRLIQDYLARISLEDIIAKKPGQGGASIQTGPG